MKSFNITTLVLAGLAAAAATSLSGTTVGAAATDTAVLAAARQVLPDLEANGQAALVFARPPDERACQVKATFTGSRPANDAERERVQAQWERWVDRLAMIGVSRGTLEPWTSWPCVAIRLRVTAIFNQTPGPNAGAQLA